MSDVLIWHAEGHEGHRVQYGQAWFQDELFLDNAGFRDMEYNWSDAVSIENEFNVVSVVGLSTFQDGCKLFAACVSMLRLSALMKLYFL